MSRASFVVGGDGSRISYVFHSGRGPVLVFLHGAGGNGTVWAPFVNAFASRPRVVIDLRGHGRGDLLAPWSWDAAVEDVALVLRKEGIRGAVVIGNCLGASVGVALRRRHPELVSRLVLCSVVDCAYLRGASFLRVLAWTAASVCAAFSWRRPLSWLDRQHHRSFSVWLMPWHDLRNTSGRNYFRSIVDLLRYPLRVRDLDVPSLIVMGVFDPFCRLHRLVVDSFANPLVDLRIVAANHLVTFLFPEVALPMIRRFVEAD